MQQTWQQLIKQTVQDNTLREAYDWEPIAGGSSNSIFLGRLNRPTNRDNNNEAAHSPCPETVVLRVNAPAKDTPGVVRDREAAILNTIQHHPWAPQIISNKPEQGWCLMHRYHPIHNEQADPMHLPARYYTPLLSAIDTLQAIPVCHTSWEMDYLNLLNKTYLPVALKRQDADAQACINAIKNDLATLPTLPACLVHHDIHIGNLMVKSKTEVTERENLILLDWEYAAIGNPWFDASCLSRYLSIPAEQIHALTHFKSLDQSTFHCALAKANNVTATLQNLWHWIRK